MENENILDEVKEIMCDSYCRFPHMLDENALKCFCDSCPLDKLEVNDGRNDPV